MFLHRSLILLGKVFLVHVLILLSALFLYSSQNLFPTELYRDKLHVAHTYGLIDANAITRAPTGWGSDKATECLSLGMGLQKSSSLGDRLLNYHPNSTTTYNPCEGLVHWIQGDEEQYVFQSYARYWHGHSEIIRWLVLIFGLPIARSLIWLSMFVMLIALWNTLQKALSETFVRSRVLSSLIVGTYAFFAGLPDLHSSMTHILSEISVLGIALISYKVLRLGDSTRIVLVGYLLGGSYVCTSYMINPQSIPPAVLVWATIPIMFITKQISYNLKKYIHLMSSLVLGFISVWASKWIIISILTPYNIWSEVKSQALHRSSHSADSLSEGVSRHFVGLDNYPAFLRAIVANFAALISKIYDPRYSSFLALSIYLLAILFSIVLYTRLRRQESVTKESPQVLHGKFALSVALIWLFSIFQILIWYAFLTQHSFDHATYTYRSLAISLSAMPMILATIASANRSMSQGKS